MEEQKILIPHGNEIKKIRDFQNELCKKYNLCPIFPLVIRKIEFKKNEKILFLKSANLQEKNDTIFLEIVAKTNENEKCGKLFLAKRIEKIDTKQKIDEELKINFPVFQIAKIREIKSENFSSWKIFAICWATSEKSAKFQ